MKQPDLTRYTVDAETGCHIWHGPMTRDGYGVVSYDQAHRAVWKALRGPIPDGLHIDHLCRTRNCVNPDHMELVTKAENTRRGESFAAVNARKTHCANGHPFDEANTYFRPAGQRDCRKCGAERQRRAKLKRKSA